MQPLRGETQAAAAVHNVQVTEHTSFQGVHKYQINSLKFMPARDSMSLLTACCLGHTCLTDIETGMHRKVVDLNPEVPTSSCLPHLSVGPG